MSISHAKAILISVAASATTAAVVAPTAVNFVTRQTSSPGAAETGHLNITGNALAGRVGVNTSPTSARVQVNETGTLQGVRALTNTGTSVFGQSNATSGVVQGGYFTAKSSNGRGLVAENFATTGFAIGARGATRSVEGIGLLGSAQAAAPGSEAVGVQGDSLSESGIGVKGTSTGAFGTGVFAMSKYIGTRSYGDQDGVLGQAKINGVRGEVLNAELSAAGVFGRVNTGSAFTFGVFGEDNAGGWAVYANGTLGASGTKSFQIDHPTDPENMYLLHYSSESPEPQNFYNGTVVTDAQGKAWVQLPDYFADINKDPRYQLTVIGNDESATFVQAKIARRIQGNRFLIMTSAPRVEVSWEVKAVRNDRWVQRYGAPTLVPKIGGAKGTYLRPELYGKPESFGVAYRFREPRQSSVHP